MDGETAVVFIDNTENKNNKTIKIADLLTLLSMIINET